MTTIKFEHGNGSIDFVSLTSRYSPMAAVLGIGALSLTAKQDSSGAMIYATDQEGLKEALSEAKGLAEYLQGSISAISSVLGSAIRSDGYGAIEAEDQTTVCWVLSGLADLAAKVDGFRMLAEGQVERR